MNPKKKKMVDELRKRIGDDGFDEDSMKMLADIIRDKNPDSINALVLLNEYTDDDDRINEMYTVIHTVEQFPRDVYIQHLVESLPELSISSPYLLDMLLRRLLCSTAEDVKLLSDSLLSSNLKIKQRAKDAFHRISVDAAKHHPDVSQRAKMFADQIGR